MMHMTDVMPVRVAMQTSACSSGTVWCDTLRRRAAFIRILHRWWYVVFHLVVSLVFPGCPSHAFTWLSRSVILPLRCPDSASLTTLLLTVPVDPHRLRIEADLLM